MSEQENETPVWHSIVGDGWEPVPFGEMTLPNDEVLLAGGWTQVDVDGFIYLRDMRPRRRRQRSYDVLAIHDGTILPR